MRENKSKCQGRGEWGGCMCGWSCLTESGIRRVWVEVTREERKWQGKYEGLAMPARAESQSVWGES